MLGDDGAAVLKRPLRGASGPRPKGRGGRGGAWEGGSVVTGAACGRRLRRTSLCGRSSAGGQGLRAPRGAGGNGESAAARTRRLFPGRICSPSAGALQDPGARALVVAAERRDARLDLLAREARNRGRRIHKSVSRSRKPARPRRPPCIFRRRQYCSAPPPFFIFLHKSPWPPRSQCCRWQARHCNI